MLSTKHLGNKLNPIKGITATLGFILCLSLSPLGKEIKLKAPLSPGLEGGNGCAKGCVCFAVGVSVMQDETKPL